MINFNKLKVLVAVFCAVVVFSSCIHLCAGEDYGTSAQQQNQQGYGNSGSDDHNINGYSTPSTPPFTQNHHRNHHNTRNAGYPTESRTGLVVPLFFPMIVFVGVVLLIFFAVVGSAAVIGSASPIGRHDVVPTRYAFARDLSSSAVLARDVLSGEQCVERISCELFRAAKGYKAQNWMLRAMDFLPAQSNLTKRALRTLWSQSKISGNQRTGKRTNSCLEFQCSSVATFMRTAKKLAS